jgi:uncharacterized protein YbaR (Trm112 family)
VAHAPEVSARDRRFQTRPDDDRSPACHTRLSSLPDQHAPRRRAREVVCDEGHRFPIVDEIPRLLPGGEGSDARSIRVSFSGEWAELRHGQDRPWGQDLDTRRAIALRELDCSPKWLRGRRVLDAGCGAGKRSLILAEWGCGSRCRRHQLERRRSTPSDSRPRSRSDRLRPGRPEPAAVSARQL